MILVGKVFKGTVILPPGADLPEGSTPWVLTEVADAMARPANRAA